MSENPYGDQGESNEPTEPTVPLPPMPPTPPQPAYGGPTMPPPSYTQPYPTQPTQSYYGYGQPPAPAPAPEPKQRQRRGGLVFATGVVAAALVAGGAAGVGAAAAYHHNDTTSASSSGNGGINVIAPSASGNAAAQTDPSAPAGSIEKVAADVLPSVVKIEVEGSTEAGSGSGIILNDTGDILTNNHVVAIAGSSGKIRVDFNDGTTQAATIVGTDPTTDTAVIKVPKVKELVPATIGSSDAVKVGQSVVAIGSPFGLDSTVTSGIVSALNRPVDVGQASQTTSIVYPAIQTDAAINPGNSGGPLVNLSGQVIGINASIQSTSDSQTSQGGSIGLGFAIPIDEVLPVIQQMMKGETPTHARIGISVPGDDSQSDGLFQANGAKVREVEKGSPASQAGIKVGDVITSVNGQLISDGDSLIATIRSYRPDDTVKVTWTRNGKEMSAEVKLESDVSSDNS